jgi:hypothetical protein
MSTWETTTTRTDTLVEIDTTPLWVRLNCIEALSVDEDSNDTLIHLTNGNIVRTTVEVLDVIDLLVEAAQ